MKTKNSSIPEDLTRRWTISAVLYYLRKCRCYDCEIIRMCQTITPRTCAMKRIVIELVKKFGKPKTEMIHDALEEIIK